MCCSLPRKKETTRRIQRENPPANRPHSPATHTHSHTHTSPSVSYGCSLSLRSQLVLHFTLVLLSTTSIMLASGEYAKKRERQNTTYRENEGTGCVCMCMWRKQVHGVKRQKEGCMYARILKGAKKRDIKKGHLQPKEGAWHRIISSSCHLCDDKRRENEGRSR
jgi:hypothetical protein